MINFALATREALMAELVDALVSNTNGVKPVPVRSRLRAQNQRDKLLKSQYLISLILYRGQDSVNESQVICFSDR